MLVLLWKSELLPVFWKTVVIPVLLVTALLPITLLPVTELLPTLLSDTDPVLRATLAPWALY